MKVTTRTYVSVQSAALRLGVSDAALLDWMDRRLVATHAGRDRVRRLPDTSVDAVLALLPTHSDRHGLTEAQVEAILIRHAGHRGRKRYSGPRRLPDRRPATLGDTVKGTIKGLIDAILSSPW